MTTSRKRYVTVRRVARSTAHGHLASTGLAGVGLSAGYLLRGSLSYLPCDCVQAALSGDPKPKRRATVDTSARAGGAATGDADGKAAADPLSPTGRGVALLRRSTTNLENGALPPGGWLANCLSCLCFR